MIIVNTPGNWGTVYGPFLHAPWHGFTPTDWVFPTFLFVVGNAMSFALRKYESEGDSVFLGKIFKRTAIIFFIGFLLNCFPFYQVSESGAISFIDLSKERILGVLQRIALCYCIASLAIHYLKVKGSVILSIVFLLGYWAVLYFFGDQPDPYSLQGNAALKLDLMLLGPDHLYKGEGIPFDPEGILSTFPAAVNVIFGYLVGLYIQKKGNTKGTILNLILGGVVLIAVSLIWHIGFPINKKIWTSSYVLFSVGTDMIVLSVLMYLIEIVQVKKWTYFFEVFGRNTLILYILSGVVISIMHLIKINGVSLKGWLYESLFTSWLGDFNASISFAIFYMLLIWFIGYIMDKRKVYIKV